MNCRIDKYRFSRYILRKISSPMTRNINPRYGKAENLYSFQASPEALESIRRKLAYTIMIPDKLAITK